MLYRLRQKAPWVVYTLIGASVVTFLLTSLLPGDPALAILGQETSEEAVANLREDLRLDDPLHMRYLAWVGAAVTGDLGRSVHTHQPVWDAIVERLPVTIEVGVLAILFATVVSIPLAVLAAYREGRLADKLTTMFSFSVISIPSFMAAIWLIYLFAVQFRLFPATGWTPFSVDPLANLRSVALPALTIGLAQLAIYLRVLRSDLISTLREDFIAFATVKGITRTRLLFRHALKPSLLALVTVVGVQVGAIMAGSVIVETLFALPGIGRLLVQSILQRDLITVQGVVLFTSVVYVVINLLVDLSYGMLDPRLRVARVR